MSIYLVAGIFAEGPTDQKYLGRLVARMLDEIGNQEFPAAVDILDEPYQIGLSNSPAGNLPRTIAKAIHENQECNLFIIHHDAGGDEQGVRSDLQKELDELSKELLTSQVVICVPVRETEAWMLASIEVFSALVSEWAPSLPANPEKELDPKKFLRGILETKKIPVVPYDFFGEQASLISLRRLASYQNFEHELRAAIREVGGLR